MMRKQEKEPKKEAKKEKPTQKDKDTARIKELETQLEEMTQTAKRIQAEFDNYRKRSEKDRQEQAKYAGISIIKELLPLLDNFELALKHAKQKDDFYKGVEMIYASIRELLSDNGVEPIEADGLPFDPYRHEALMSIESDQPKNTVVEVMQKGYRAGEKTLRTAKVTISKGKNKEE